MKDFFSSSRCKQNNIKEEGDFKSITVGCVLDSPGYSSRNTDGMEWYFGFMVLGLEGNSEKTTWTAWIY